MTDANVPMLIAAALVLLALLALALSGPLRRWRFRRRRRLLDRAVMNAGSDFLHDIAVPDGEGGCLHLDYLLLTHRGLLVIDLRDVKGVVFGGEHMREWTVINGVERSTFLNPLEPLYDRIAALKALAAEVPVDGRIVFTESASFPKGRPPLVLMLNSLAAEFPLQDRAASKNLTTRFREPWAALKQQLQLSPHTRH